MKFTVNLQKEKFKFSGTHFTIFGPNTGERLHGHNYQVSVKLHLLKLDEQLGMAFDFNLVKPVIQQLCDSLDEVILLPMKSPFLIINEIGQGPQAQIQVQFHQKSYLFPKEDVCPLPLVNITSEELAKHFALQLQLEIKKINTIQIQQIEVTVEETRGQSVTCSL